MCCFKCLQWLRHGAQEGRGAKWGTEPARLRSTCFPRSKRGTRLFGGRFFIQVRGRGLSWARRSLLGHNLVSYDMLFCVLVRPRRWLPVLFHMCFVLSINRNRSRRLSPFSSAQPPIAQRWRFVPLHSCRSATEKMNLCGCMLACPHVRVTPHSCTVR